MNHVEVIEHQGVLFGIIIRKEYENEGIQFFTPDTFSQQLAQMSHPKGKVIAPHVHNKITREVHFTQEVLLIKKGVLRCDFYAQDQSYIESVTLRSGDVILLANGGHGFEVLEDVQMIEIKQGPYAGDKDKTRFEGISSNKIKALQS